MSRQAAPGKCRGCGGDSWTADEAGPVHACCSAWREVIEAGRRCPACEAGPWLRSPNNAGREMAPLPRFLPGGQPFRPDLERAEAVRASAATVTELEAHRGARRRPEPELEAG